MRQTLGLITLLVKDYDEAIAFYTEKLHFELVSDIKLSDSKRWIVVAPPGSKETKILLAEAANDEQASRIGNQTGGRVFLFLYTDNFKRDHDAMKKADVHFLENPRSEPYGTVAVFEDLYGNKWDLLQSNE